MIEKIPAKAGIYKKVLLIIVIPAKAGIYKEEKL
jgi:hypothetical protein